MIMGDGLLSLSWNNHSSTFCHMLSTIRGMEKYSDVTLACDGRFYPAHKLVLSTCSDYFHNMFEKTPCKHPIIVIKDVAFKNIEALLSYMYAGIVNVSQSDLAQLIKAAELLEIKGLAVPDEPPSTSKRSSHAQGSSSSPKRSSHMRASSTSPQRKRHRRDTSPLTHDSTAVSSPGSPDSSPHRRDTKQTREPTARHTDRGETRQDQSKDSKGERKSSREIDREAHQIQNHSAEQADEHLSSVESSDNLPEALNESLIKEEKVEVECDGDGGYDYGALLGGLPGEGDDSTHTMQHFPHHTFDNNPGPSGLQGWSGVSDGGDGGGTGYGSETSSDLQLITQQGQQHHLQHPVRVKSDGGEGSDSDYLTPPSDNRHYHHHQSSLYPTTTTTTTTSTLSFTSSSDSITTFTNIQAMNAPSHTQATYSPTSMGATNAPSLNRSTFLPINIQNMSASVDNQMTFSPSSSQGSCSLAQFKCPHCPYTSTFKHNVNTHLRKHTGERPYACSHCDYTASYRSNMKRHMLRHTMENL